MNVSTNAIDYIIYYNTSTEKLGNNNKELKLDIKHT